jgi:hypothetical protein
MQINDAWNAVKWLPISSSALAAETEGVMTTKISEMDRKAALKCIAIVDCHFPLNEGEKRLLGTIVNEIRLAFDLEGAVKPVPLLKEAAWVPREWFW